MVIGDSVRRIAFVLVREGYAQVTIYPPDDRYEVALYALQDLAIMDQAGGWTDCGW